VRYVAHPRGEVYSTTPKRTLQGVLIYKKKTPQEGFELGTSYSHVPVCAKGIRITHENTMPFRPSDGHVDSPRLSEEADDLWVAPFSGCE
jgi:hypothetical protein